MAQKQFLKGRKAIFNLLVKVFVSNEITSKGQLHRRIQVVINPNGRKDVSYDDEAMCMASVKLREGLSKKESEDVYFNEVVSGRENISIVDAFVPGKENSLHITCRKHPKTGDWQIVSNFIFNKKRAEKYYQKAGEFIESAKFAQKSGSKTAFAVNLFKALELIFTGFVITIPDIDLETRECRPFYPYTPQETWHQRLFDSFKELSGQHLISRPEYEVAKDMFTLYNDLGYVKKDHEFSNEKMEQYLKIVEKKHRILNLIVSERARYFNNND
ncbi:MAG: hypothetical protein ACXADY_02835 [Candidatus Hodarchaeales archaeon]|jgi:hypothetical protein